MSRNRALKDGRGEGGRVDVVQQGWGALAYRTVTPLAFLAGALILPAFMLHTTRPFRGSGLGPAAWPHFILMLAAVSAALWTVQEIIGWRRGSIETGDATSVGDDETYSYPKALTGLVLIIAYGWALPVIGFPIATVLFMALWCFLGGTRNPLAVLPVSIIGTITLLWVFMGLALMPLNRGVGIFDTINVQILQALGIY